MRQDYAPSNPHKQKAPKRKGRSTAGDEDNEQQAYIDSKASRKIISLGQDLTAEEEAEQEARRPQNGTKSAFEFERSLRDEEDSDEEAGIPADDEAWGDEEDEEVEEVEVDPEDLAMFNKFNPEFDPSTLLAPESNEEQGDSTNLADLILEKIAQHEASQAQGHVIRGGGAPEDAIELPAKVVEVYTQIGMILSRFRSGKLPKPFKILPTLPQWDTLLSITRPDSWTANATYEATRLFTSSRPAVAQAFIHDILLDRVRDDIRETKKLNVHLYKALKKALYKPACFFKGLLFPLLASGTCTLREAHIISSVLVRVSIPVLHSAAAIHRLCEIAAEQMTDNLEAGGATNIFIRVLLEKKYALPYKVVDAVVFHFLRFRAVDADAMTDAPATIKGGEKLPADGVDGDEAGGVLGTEVADDVHGGLVHVVELLGVGPAAEDAEGALVDAAADGTVDAVLRSGNALEEELALGGEVETVSWSWIEGEECEEAYLGVVEGQELITESANLTVHGETLEIDVSGAKAGKTGGLVAATRLETDEAVLDNVDTANTVLAGNGVDSKEELGGIGDSLAAGELSLDGQTLLEVKDKVLGLLGSLGGVDGQLPHVLGGSDVGVLEDTGLVTAVGQILVHAPGLALCAGDGDAGLLGVVEEILATLEAVVEDGVAPWGNDLDGGLQGVEGQLEADLVVALTGAAVRDGETALLLGDGNLGAGNDGTGERNVLVDGIALDSGPAELLDELLAEILNVALLGTNLEGLLAGSIKVLLLANIGHEADDAVALVQQVLEDT
ncbi:Bystin-domain-containing protein [Aureobasidium pullulans]|uniref:Bystin-domain-containing protein n=1 Tax=Aureobasidium pullulans TaxID=5580 RepID=A0A4S9F812_AURPU|nr:Bystin-domain-containing protein [Aureobasidium pullulans]